MQVTISPVAGESPHGMKNVLYSSSLLIVEYLSICKFAQKVRYPSNASMCMQVAIEPAKTIEDLYHTSSLCLSPEMFLHPRDPIHVCVEKDQKGMADDSFLDSSDHLH